MQKYRGHIFDMDGVVVDNHQFHFKAWMEFSKKYGFSLDEKIYRENFNGKTNRDLFMMIFGENISSEQIQSWTSEKEGLYRELYLPHMTPVKGLINFLENLQRHRHRLALGTSAPGANVDYILEGLFLRKYFNHIVDGSMVLKGKPHPEVYLKCCDKLNLRPQECVVYEDSIAGIEAARNAGCAVVGLATSHEAYELRPYTDIIWHDFNEGKIF
jgi:beta-phosphoglucomutase